MFLHMDTYNWHSYQDFAYYCDMATILDLTSFKYLIAIFLHNAGYLAFLDVVNNDDGTFLL